MRNSSTSNDLFIGGAGSTSQGNPSVIAFMLDNDSNMATNNTVTQAMTIYGNTGNIQIGGGTTVPTSKLQVSGSVTNTSSIADIDLNIDFSESNLAYTTASAGAITLTNVKDGGTYTLNVRGTTAGTSTFTASGFTFKTVNNGATTAGKETIYTFLVLGTVVYVYMVTGI